MNDELPPISYEIIIFNFLAFVHYFIQFENKNITFNKGITLQKSLRSIGISNIKKVQICWRVVAFKHLTFFNRRLVTRNMNIKRQFIL